MRFEVEKLYMFQKIYNVNLLTFSYILVFLCMDG